MVKKTLRASSLREGGEKTVWRVDCCRRANKKFGETLTRGARVTPGGVCTREIWAKPCKTSSQDRGNCSCLGRIRWGGIAKEPPEET